ncbi:hypothetical protein CEXT_288091 [Caerostris extrusa]|uniref:Uncharacterized protein n=1 Tax=Caerostris extrusa TaxID=172846 RepID=A0AAV4P9N3_CAEEX|nr:hypothetical protein CEXT_288091 [Caerostris extrusa]
MGCHFFIEKQCMVICVSQIQCAALEHGVALELFGRRWPFSPEQHIKWNSISTSPKQKKNETPVEQYSSNLRNGKLSPYFPPPFLIRFRDPQARFYPFPTRLPLY